MADSETIPAAGGPGELSRARFQRNANFFLVFRVLVAGLAVGSFSLYRFQVPETLSPETAWWVYLFLLAAVVLNVPYYLVHRFLPHWRFWIVVELLVDLGIETVLVYLTGGFHSIFLPLYIGSILAAGVFVSTPWALMYASLGTISLCVVSVLYFLSAEWEWTLPGIGVSFPRSWFSFSFGSLLLYAGLFHVVALLTTRLMSGLRGMEQRTRVILDVLSDGVVSFDRRLRVTFINPEACRMLSLPGPAGQYLGKPCEEILKAQRDREGVRRVLEEGGAYWREGVRPGLWEPVWYQMRVTPLQADPDSERGGVMVLTDLTWRKRTEEAVRRADRLESVAEVAAGIAHELRNPLSSIRGCAQELERTVSGDQRTSRLMDLLVRECDRLNRIVGGVLDFARPRRVFPQPVHLEGMVAELVRELERSAEREEIRIETDIPPELEVKCDPDLLRHALANLGRNGLEAMQGKGTLTIRAGTATRRREGRERDGFEIRFEDTGCGIPRERLAHLFKPFFTTREEGTGLGLAIAQRCVQAHGGEIRVNSEEGKGSAFVIWLPEEPEAGEEAMLKWTGRDGS